jgi:HSP20 family protein
MAEYFDMSDAVRQMQEDMDRAFSRFFSGRNGRPLLESADKGGKLSMREPLIDIMDGKDEIMLQIEVPGVRKEDINVNVGENSLTVQAEVMGDKKEEEKGYYYHEKRYKAFSRSMTLPVAVIPEKSDAAYNNGVLKISLKKKTHGLAVKDVALKVK